MNQNQEPNTIDYTTAPSCVYSVTDKPKKNYKAIIIALILLIPLIATLYFLPNAKVLFSRATSTSYYSYSLENSYLFASPIQAKANNADKVRITVFILDSRGLGVSNRQVNLLLPDFISNQHIQAITDSNGKAIFDLASSTVGTYEITATTDNQKIPQKVKIVFY